MKKLFTQLVLFFVFCIFCLLVLTITTNKMIETGQYFKIAPNIKQTIVGNSISSDALNDSLIVNFANFASPADAVIYSYLKVKTLLRCNEQIQTVFLNISAGIMTNSNEFIFDDKNFPYKFPLYAPFMTWTEQKLFLSLNFIGFIGLSYKKNS